MIKRARVRKAGCNSNAMRQRTGMPWRWAMRQRSSAWLRHIQKGFSQVQGERNIQQQVDGPGAPASASSSSS
jgi:hypothetical protein